MEQISATSSKFCRILANVWWFFAKHFENGERCEGAYCVDLGERFPTHIWLQSSASIQRRTSPVKFARSKYQNPPVFWYFGCPLYFDTLLVFCTFTLKSAKVCTQSMSSGLWTSDGSFSVVSTRPIARIGAFVGIFRDLQDLHTFAPLRSQKFAKIS